MIIILHEECECTITLKQIIEEMIGIGWIQNRCMLKILFKYIYTITSDLEMSLAYAERREGNDLSLCVMFKDSCIEAGTCLLQRNGNWYTWKCNSLFWSWASANVNNIKAPLFLCRYILYLNIRNCASILMTVYDIFSSLLWCDILQPQTWEGVLF